MQKKYHKYFWSGETDFDNMHPVYFLRRILEYASFPDIISFPFQEFKTHIHEINIDKLWTGEKHKLLFKYLLPYLSESNSWDELFEKYIDAQKIELR